MSDTATVQLDDLKTVSQLAAEYPGVLNVWMLRQQLRRRSTNGLALCCVWVGRRLLISRSKYAAWLTSRMGAPRA